MIFGFARKKNIFLLQHYHPIRHIHCQIAASEFLTDFDSWDMLTIIGSRSPIGSFELVWVQPSFPPPLRHWNSSASLDSSNRSTILLVILTLYVVFERVYCVLTMCYFSVNVSSKENIKILWLIFMFYYSDIIAIKNSYWFFSLS